VFAALGATEPTVKLGRNLARGVQSKVELLKKVTEWVRSNIRYKKDIANYKTIEYFATPALTLKRRFGDCDDQAILISSILAGTGKFGTEDLRLALGSYVIEKILPGLISGTILKMIFGYRRVEDHAWLEARVDNNWYICDATIRGHVCKVPCERYIPDVYVYGTKIERIKFGTRCLGW